MHTNSFINIIKIPWTLTRKFIYPLLITGLLSLNLLTLVSDGVYSALYNSLSYLPFQQLMKNSSANKYKKLSGKMRSLSARNAKLNQKFKKSAHIVKKVSRRIGKRTLRNIVENIAAIPGESVPLIGAAVVITITSIDLIDACNNMKDMDEIRSALNIQDEEDYSFKICGKSL